MYLSIALHNSNSKFGKSLKNDKTYDFLISDSIKSFGKHCYHKHIDDEWTEKSNTSFNEEVLVGFLNIIFVFAVHISWLPETEYFISKNKQFVAITALYLQIKWIYFTNFNMQADIHMCINMFMYVYHT